VTVFRKVLIANRGEIALRIIRTLREMNIQSVAVYSEPDKQSPHVRFADEASEIGPAPARDSYLSADKILTAAHQAKVDAIIPGYGFLSENAAFAQRCLDEGIVFIGPAPQAIEAMGLKPQARARMAAAGVPVVPGGNAASLEEARATAERVGYPIMLKAAAGGGGRGMRRVAAPDALKENIERAQSEAKNSFGDATVYIEKEVTGARHVEIQVLGDQHGNLVHLYERDCSIQRRHQKVIEETPSPLLSERARQGLCETALRGARSVGYYSVGTFEFLVDPEENYYFLEMNTRLQVEHPITELIVGLDLVREMLRVAAGEPLGYGQSDIQRRGAAIECRVYAEDPSKNFLPKPGTIQSLVLPEGPGVRHDGGIAPGYVMSHAYDAMLAKLCVWAPNREQAILRMRRALGEYDVTGLVTNLHFHRQLLWVDDFVQGRYDTGFIERHKAVLTRAPEPVVDRDTAAAVLAVAQLATDDQAASVPPGTEPSPWVMTHRKARLGT
jgi:acetyl-CoA carboxylase biotin carboxylase subunit